MNFIEIQIYEILRVINYSTEYYKSYNIIIV